MKNALKRPILKNAVPFCRHFGNYKSAFEINILIKAKGDDIMWRCFFEGFIRKRAFRKGERRFGKTVRIFRIGKILEQSDRHCNCFFGGFAFKQI